MPFEQIPYTNFHGTNQDWIIRQIKNLVEDWATYSDNMNKAYAAFTESVNAQISELNGDWSDYKDQMNAAFSDLHDYVYNYFANLDVQDEINTKLDEMTAQGLWDDILRSFFDSYSAEIDQKVANQDAIIAKLRTDMDTFLQTYNYVTPKMYGAVGDGVKDDTEAIKEAFSSGKSVKFTSGTYKVSFEDDTTEKQVLFNLSSNRNVIFDPDAKIIVSGTNFANLTTVFGCSTFPVSNVNIIGANISCDNDNATLPMAIRFEAPNNSAADQITNINIENCTFANVASSIYMVHRSSTGSLSRQVSNIIIKNCRAYNSKSSFVTADGNNIIIDGCYANGGNIANTYDAVSVHSGIDIKIINNTFEGYTTGQTINIRNSPENKCGTKNVIVNNNTIRNCTTTAAIQVSVSSGENVYGCTDVTITNNHIINCTRALMVTCGNATSGTPFKGMTISNNTIEDCTTSVSLSNNTTVWLEKVTLTGNTIINSGNFTIHVIRQCSITGNYINLATNGVVKIDYLYYSTFTGNTVYVDNTEVQFEQISNSLISGNFFNKTCNIKTPFSTSDFIKNTCAQTLTIDTVAGFNVKTEIQHGILTAYANGYPTDATAYSYKVGDKYIAITPDNTYAWICTVAGSPGTWKSISLS